MNKATPNSATLDEVHQAIMSIHQENEVQRIPQLLDKYKELKKKLNTTKTRSAASIDEYMETKDRIIEVRRKMENIKKEKKRYMLRNATDIFTYFEDKQKISTGTNVQNKNALNAFFKIKTGSQEDINPERYSQSKKLYRYWQNIHAARTRGIGATTEDAFSSSYARNYVYSYENCNVCGSGEMIHQDEEGVLICNNLRCGRFVSYIIEGAKPSNKEPPNEVSYTAYIRLNHFKEILSQFQAKETTHIPPQVMQSIKDRIKKERIDIATQLNFKTMREILRKLGLNKYFEHIQYINSLFGIQPPLMDDKLTETLCVLFIEIQQPWALYCPPERVNFFNYTYTLYQLCVLLDQRQYLPYIALLKDNAKQKQQDDIWKLVCRDLDWQFFPTV
jgi:hypothetical protein